MDTIAERYSCCAIFISYNPEHSFVYNVTQIVNQVREIIIIDNNSELSSTIFLEELEQNQKVTIIYNQKNLGIAAALNQGVSYAIEHNYEWIATFDQDSRAPENFMESMFTTYDKYEFKHELAIISPCYFNEVYGITMPDKGKLISNIDYESMITITSGNLIKTSILKQIGLFQEDFFIDCVDTEFCLKCKINGLKIVVSCNSLLDHNLGEIAQHYFLGKTYFTTNHSPVRRFYRARNRLLIYQNYFFAKNSVRQWIFKDILISFKEILLVLLFESNRIEKIQFFLIGIVHGLRGKGGEYRNPNS
jgi:rhamnosyltransferase